MAWTISDSVKLAKSNCHISVIFWSRNSCLFLSLSFNMILCEVWNCHATAKLVLVTSSKLFSILMTKLGKPLLNPVHIYTFKVFQVQTILNFITIQNYSLVLKWRLQRMVSSNLYHMESYFYMCGFSHLKFWEDMDDITKFISNLPITSKSLL